MRAITWTLLCIILGSYITGPLMDPDLWWHVTVGRWILSHGTVPYKDYWNMFAAGKPWLAYSWSIELPVAMISSWFGETGLMALKMALMVSLAGSVCYCLGRIASDFRVGLVLGGITTMIFESYSLLRPQTFVWIYFIWLLWTLTKLERYGERTRDQLSLLVIMALWANCHITTVIGLFTIVAWRFSRHSLKSCLISLLIGFLGTLLTPYGGAEWWIFISKTDHPLVHGTIVEFGPASIRDYSTGIYLILLTILLTILHQRSKLAHLPHLFLVLILGLGGLGIVKFLPFATLALSATLAYLWNAGHEDQDGIGPLGELVNEIERGVQKIEGAGLAFFLLALGFIYVLRPFQNVLNLSIVPKAPLDFLVEKELPRPIMNPFGDGGYLMYRLSTPSGELTPIDRVSIDGRTNVNPLEISVDHGTTYGGKIQWNDFIDQVNPKTILSRNRTPLTALLIQDPLWCRAFCNGSDKEGHSLFVERNSFEPNKLKWSQCTDGTGC